MAISQETVDRIQRFAESRNNAYAEYGRQPLGSSALEAYNHKLDETLKELQNRVKRQEDELKKLRAANKINFASLRTDSVVRISQARRAKKAYDTLLKSDKELPNPRTPLPSLIAIDEVTHLIRESKSYVSQTTKSLSADRQRLKAEEANLQDARLIATNLKERIERVRKEKSAEQEKSPSELAQNEIRQQREKNERLETTTENLKGSLDKFIDNTLAAMLAAEDLGGPSVGDASDITDTMLEAGYTNHGRPKKPKAVLQPGDDAGQQRIDELVRRQTGQEQVRTISNKRGAAAAEMHELLDQLLEAGTGYVELTRDSAASRFLVKAKVAQFHPRDAKRLRLIDFGRSLEDE
ncbi:hypothetical protein ASPZODRAFT_139486 [Penicilliopsis zonata CBS 506.65]|uniref:Uncharacterized protein n=1 Tax=Penicilliopsis zonata CBS 506.65 TaxID=1073090 RepID=A0A1L9SSJ1_9EURO|nr:hypothetical protein ASPZODRAFT_139486 [Penicilliopsis zonata CBS 506.65]OJJ50168.1 hypothetical protein ASPZODRAFT_139486 [Penicilliopsis zonata CBS 506.65]